MDVRCEKCLTTYELDDAKVGDGGLTVKCQECGNLFKVRRRHDTAELVARAQAEKDDGSDTLKEEELTAPRESATEDTTAASAAGRVRKSTPARGSAAAPAAPPAAPVEERGWMLRFSATKEVARFRELTTLQQWIVERRVTRDDEISRGGDSWKQLGGIAELASFFHVVEQAAAVAGSSQPGLAVSRGGEEPEREINDQHTEILPQRRRQGPSGGLGGADVDTLFVDPRDLGRSRGATAAVFVVITLAVAAVALVAWAMRRSPQGNPPAVAQPGGEGEGDALAARGRAAFLSDTDEGFRQAISALDRALEAEQPGATMIPVRVDLAETHVTWASYLLEDARRLETLAAGAGAQAARTLRTEAQTHLERARRVLEEPSGTEAVGAATAPPPLVRAFGDLLRVEGAPANAVEKYLQRAAQKGADDPELAYALGELALREGKAQEATARLGDAARAVPGKHPGLVRAHYRLLVLALDGHKAEDARRECDAILAASPKHDRARGLCAASAPVDLGATPTPRPADAGAQAAAPGADPTLAPPPAVPKPRDAALAPVLPTDYKTLVREGDRLSENGRSQLARKLYERALELDPKGVAALTGLGYCDLDAERYMQAVDRFNAALAVDPGTGDAVVGLAESYKVRGQTARAVEQYKKYLASHPSGPKAQMAQKNLRDLEPKLAKENEGKEAPKDKPKPQEGALPRPPAPDETPKGESQ